MFRAMALCCAALFASAPPAPEDPAPAPPRAEGHRVNKLFRRRFESKTSTFQSTGSTSFGKETEAALGAALDWLVRHQSADGSWDSDGFAEHCDGQSCFGKGAAPFDPGVTGLAVLALLGSGVRPGDPGSRGAAATGGLRYLVRVQTPDGCFGAKTDVRYVYNHAIASLALVEAWAVTGMDEWRGPAQKGLDFIVACRNPGEAWRYMVRSGDNDSSVTGWMFSALQTGSWAGLPTSPTALREAIDWLDDVTDRMSGKTGYQERQDGISRYSDMNIQFLREYSESLTAMSVFMRCLAGKGITEPPVPECLRTINLCTPRWTATGATVDYYYWHYGTLATFQAGGKAWKEWQESLVPALLSGQVKDAGSHALGSWPPVDPWSSAGGRVYSTSLGALCLEVPYRLARLRDSAPERTLLSIATEPSGASVHLGDVYLGTTPLKDFALWPGPASLTLRHPATRDREVPMNPSLHGNLQLGKVVLEAGAWVDLTGLPEGMAAWHEGRRLSKVAAVRPGKVRLLFTQPSAMSRILLLDVPDGATVVPDQAPLTASPDWSGAANPNLPGPPVTTEVPGNLPAGVRAMGGRIWLEKDGSELVYVQAPAAVKGGTDKPDISSFLIGRCEVTVKQFRKFATAGKWSIPRQPDGSTEDCPVVGVISGDARNYATWAGARMPTRAEWLHAASISTTSSPRESGPRYPWGTFPTAEACRRRGIGDPVQKPAKVGSYPGGMGDTGILDIIGNAAEWTQARPAKKERPEDTPRFRLMGGSWAYVGPDRFYEFRGSEQIDSGFRILVPLD